VKADKRGPEGLAKYLQQWWNEQGWRAMKEVESAEFLDSLYQWLASNG
jgi:hypothetical protein